MAHAPANLQRDLRPVRGQRRQTSQRLSSQTCAAAHDIEQSRAGNLLIFRITAVGAPDYWLDVEADAAAALSKLDTFLRDTWVECCGHLSMFSVSGYRYSSSPSDMSDLLGRANRERSTRTKIGDVFDRIINAVEGTRGAWRGPRVGTPGDSATLTSRIER
jgi:hypothetical protein